MPAIAAKIINICYRKVVPEASLWEKVGG